MPDPAAIVCPSLGVWARHCRGLTDREAAGGLRVPRRLAGGPGTHSGWQADDHDFVAAPEAGGRRPGAGRPAARAAREAASATDSLNISPRARWVVCPLGRTRGHGRRFIYPQQVREEKKREDSI